MADLARALADGIVALERGRTTTEASLSQRLVAARGLVRELARQSDVCLSHGERRVRGRCERCVDERLMTSTGAEAPF